MNLALLILNKNEALSIESSLKGIPFEKFAVVLAIDGKSKDNSVKMFHSLNIEVLEQSNLGRGNAIREGVELILNKFPLITGIVLFSTDGNEDAKDINSLIRLLPDYDLVIASRMLAQSWNKEDYKRFKPRKLTNKIFAYLGYISLYSKGLSYISDPLNGLRGFKIDFFNKLNLLSGGYAVEFEMSLKAYLLKSKYCEFPTREGIRSYGVSQVPPVQTIFELIKVLFNLSLRRVFILLKLN